MPWSYSCDDNSVFSEEFFKEKKSHTVHVKNFKINMLISEREKMLSSAKIIFCFQETNVSIDCFSLKYVAV